MSLPVSQATLQAELPHRAGAPLGRPSKENQEADPRRIPAEPRVSLLALVDTPGAPQSVGGPLELGSKAKLQKWQT